MQLLLLTTDMRCSGRSVDTTRLMTAVVGLLR